VVRKEVWLLVGRSQMFSEFCIRMRDLIHQNELVDHVLLYTVIKHVVTVVPMPIVPISLKVQWQ
jgi:hypothetical protein